MDLTDAEIIKLTGPSLILTILNWGLFGVLSVQVYLYSQAFPNDRPRLKVMVYAVYLLEATQTILLTGTAWNGLVKGFGHTDILYKVGTIWFSVCLIGGATALVAQTFYAYRILIISQNKIIPTFITLMSLTSFVGAAVITGITKQAGTFDSVQAHMLRTSIFLGIWAGTSCACDILIAACMCFYLSRRIRDGLFPKTQALVSKVMRMTIETGALTASVSVVTLAVYYSPGFGGFVYYGVPSSALAKLYSNTMLALLNSRMKLGIISESTTWQDNVFPLIPLSHLQQTDDIEMKFAPINTVETEIHVGAQDNMITRDEAKVTFSDLHKCEGTAHMEHNNPIPSDTHYPYP